MRTELKSKAPAKVVKAPTKSGGASGAVPASDTTTSHGGIWFGKKHTYSYAEVFKADPVDRIEAIKQGMPAQLVVKIADDLHVTQQQLIISLGLPYSTITRKVKSRENLTTEQAERVLGLSKLVGQVQTMVEQSGNPENFDAAEWVGKWIARPNPALGGVPPSRFLDTGEGQGIVSGLLSKMLSGAVA